LKKYTNIISKNSALEIDQRYSVNNYCWYSRDHFCVFFFILSAIDDGYFV